MDKNENKKYAFAGYLQEHHSGKENAITAGKLSNWGTRRQIRRWCHDLRLEGYPISSGQTGYYYAGTPEELKESINFLVSLNKEIWSAVVSLSKTLGEMEKK